MHCRWAALLALVAGCEVPAEKAPPPTAWVYPPPGLPVWPLGRPTATIGRAQAPQVAVETGIAYERDRAAGAPLQLPTIWDVPDTAEALAVVYGTREGKHIVEVIDIDAGMVVSRDAVTCKGPVVAVLKNDAVCANGSSVGVLPLDGVLEPWSLDDARFIAVHRLELVVARSGSVVVLHVSDGDEVERIKLPAGVTPDSILASCSDHDKGLDLLAQGQDGRLVRVVSEPAPAKIQWAVPLEQVTAIDGCWHSTMIITLTTPRGVSLVAMERDTGKQLGRIDRVLGHWGSRDGTTDIEVSTATGIARWPRELTGAGVQLEPHPLGELLGSHGELRLVRATPSTAVLLDRRGVRAYLAVPELGAALGERAFVASTWTGAPSETVHRRIYPERYSRALRFEPGPARHVNVPAELRDLPAVETASTREPDAAVLKDLKMRGWLHDQPIGGPQTATHLVVSGMQMTVAYEQGRVVAKLPRVQMLPAWSVVVNGVIAKIEPAGDGVLVVLEDGDAYRIDARTGAATALAGIGADWRVLGDLIANTGNGGPIPPENWHPAPAASDAVAPTKGARKAAAKKKKAPDDEGPPRLMTPIPAPRNVRPSYQLTLYAVTGELRVRNDYALEAPVTPGRRAPGAPIILEGGEEERQALVVDPATGDPVRRIRLPDEVIPGSTFSTVVDGKPVVGAMLANPVRVVLF